MSSFFVKTESAIMPLLLFINYRRECGRTFVHIDCLAFQFECKEFKEALDVLDQTESFQIGAKASQICAEEQHPLIPCDKVSLTLVTVFNLMLFIDLSILF